MHPVWQRLYRFLIIALFASYTGSALAVKGWDTTAGLTVQTIYSDNVDLAAEDEEDDFGLRVTPSIGISRTTRYNKLRFNYGLTFQEHSSSLESDDIRHNLTSTWNSEISRDVLFLDLTANASQTLLSRGGDDFNTNNTTQTFTYVFHPYVKHHFGSYADMEVGFTHDGVLFDSDSAGDSTGNEVDYSITSGRRFQFFSWALAGNYGWVDQDDADDDETYGNARGDVSYRLNRYWTPSFYVAYEDNDYETDSDSEEGFGYGGGVTWTPNRKFSLYVVANSKGEDFGAEVKWRPSSRTELGMSFGTEFLRDSFSFDFSHRMRQGVITASYHEDPDAASRDEILERQTFQLVDSFGNAIADPITGQPILVAQDTPRLDDERYVLSRFRLQYDVNFGRRNSAGIGAYYSNRDYHESGDDESSWGLDARWSHGLARNLMSNIRVSWETFEDEQEGDSDQWSIGAGLTYNFTQKTSMTLDLQHNVEDAELASSDYTENRVTLTLGTSW